MYRCQQADKAPRIERLRRRLYCGEPARLKPRKGRMLDRRESLEASLRLAIIVERQARLKGAWAWIAQLGGDLNKTL
jgi:hypothetical protein